VSGEVEGHAPVAFRGLPQLTLLYSLPYDELDPRTVR